MLIYMALGVQHRNDIDKSAHGKDRFVGEVVALVWPAAIVNEQLVKHLRRGIQTFKELSPDEATCNIWNRLIKCLSRIGWPGLNELKQMRYESDNLSKLAKAYLAKPTQYEIDWKKNYKVSLKEH